MDNEILIKRIVDILSPLSENQQNRVLAAVLILLEDCDG